MEEKKKRPQDRWDEKAGMISKTYKVNKKVAEEFHIGRAEDEGDGMLLGFAFQVAERAFVVCVEGIHQRDGCNRFFHGNLRFFSYIL